jgi:dTDP-4-dehydrorhamnose reductase
VLRVLVIGAGGMLSTDLVEVLKNKYQVIALTEKELDIRHADRVTSSALDSKPDVIINCAAFTDVDGCEDQEELAFAVNADGAGNVAAASAAAGSRLIHISTDFIFDGGKTTPYIEEDPPAPLSVYGSSKLEGERQVTSKAAECTIVRTAWLFGIWGYNFVEKVIKWYASTRPIKVVEDQVGTPSYTVDVSRAIDALIENGCSGVFNVSNSGICSRFEFARGILKAAGFDEPELHPGTTSEFPTPAERPAYSALSTDRLSSITGFEMPGWQNALARYFEKRQEVRGPIQMETA